MRPRVHICFHGIGRPERQLETGEAPYWISDEFFVRILDMVVGRPHVRLSFDDGNISDYTIGLPRLRERNLTATVFALAGRLGNPGSLGERELRELRDAGIRIGNHGMDHTPWDHLTPGRANVELVMARKRLAAAIDAPVDEAALPFGSYRRSTLRHLRQAGYRRVYSSDGYRSPAAAWLQARYSVRADDTLDDIRALINRRTPLADLRGRLRARVKGLRP